MGHFLQNMQDILHSTDFLVVNQDIWILQLNFHFFAVGNEIRRDITTVELHTFYHIYCCIGTFCFFNSNNPFFTHFAHSSSNQLANFCIAVGRNSSNLLNFLRVVTNCLRLTFQAVNYLAYRFINPSLQIHWIRTSSNVFQSLRNNRLRQYSCSSSSVTRLISGFRCYFLYHLGTHVFNRIFQFNFFSYGYPIFGYLGSSKFLFNNHVATFGSEGYFNRIGQGIYPFLHPVSCINVEKYLFCHIFLFFTNCS